jgi:hypothetical protein
VASRTARRTRGTSPLASSTGTRCTAAIDALIRAPRKDADGIWSLTVSSTGSLFEELVHYRHNA